MPYKNKEDSRKRLIRYRKEKNKNGLCRTCFNKKLPNSTSCKECTLKQKENDRKKHQELKRKVIYHYSNGTMKCFCCPESHIEFLSLDHVNGGGNLHCKQLNRYGSSFYEWLIKNNFPKDVELRVACMNCNFARGKFGYCPHEKE